MRTIRRWLAVTLVVLLVMLSSASGNAQPIPPQCSIPSFARANPNLCEIQGGTPFGVGGGSPGGGGGGGVLGGIPIVGGLLKGLGL
jgi:hypothetical protein